MIELVLFRIHPRQDVDEADCARAYERTVELVQDLDGFVSVEEFAAADGSELTLARFESTEAIDAWRQQPDHVRTRERGRDDFFAAYDITIATVHKQDGWSRDSQLY